LHLMGTLDRPSAGAVRLRGTDVAGLSDRELSALRAQLSCWLTSRRATWTAPLVPRSLNYCGNSTPRAPRSSSSPMTMP
jgi:hypothetical protein